MAQNTYKIASEIYNKTCRYGFDEPGFCLVDVGEIISPVSFRQLMVDIKKEMAAIHASRKAQTLIYHSACRFDQQESTKPHLDGGPSESILMLGYEPSEVDSRLEIVDYTKCAFELGLSLEEFMSKYNPMFASSAEILEPYTTYLSDFLKSSFQILCINNSSAPYSKDTAYLQGVLHTATILDSHTSKSRFINSTMIAPAPLGSHDLISADDIESFIHGS